MAESAAMSLAAWSPLAGGILSGKFTREDVTGGESNHRRHGQRTRPRHRPNVQDVADDLGVTSSQVAIAWTMAQPGGASHRRRQAARSARRQPRCRRLPPRRRVAATARRRQRHQPRVPARLPPRTASRVRRRRTCPQREGASDELPDRPHRRPGHAGQLVRRPRTRRPRRGRRHADHLRRALVRQAIDDADVPLAVSSSPTPIPTTTPGSPTSSAMTSCRSSPPARSPR